MHHSADNGISEQHVTNNSSANSYVRYKYLDKNNLIKCNECRNYTDITCEQYDDDSLSAWLSLMSSSDKIGYVCKYCKSIKEQNKLINERFLYLSSQVEQYKKVFAALEKKVSEYEIKLSITEKDLSATKGNISTQNKQNDNGIQDKYINDIAQAEIPDIPKDPKEAVPLHPKITKVRYAQLML